MSERIFSKTGDIITKKRSLIKPDNLDQMIFLNFNINKLDK